MLSVLNYPAPILQLLEDIVTALKHDGLVSLLLVGSGGRGELRYNLEEGRLRVFSDLEFYALVNQGFPTDGCLQRIKRIESAVRENSPYFHIDIVFLESTRKKFPNNLDLVEAKRESVLMTGRDFRQNLPSKPDVRQVVEGSFSQLWELLYHIDFYEFPASLDRFEVRYALARTSLHLLTLVLVLEGVIRPKLRDKVLYFSENHATLRAARFLDAEYVDFFGAALSECQMGKMTRSPIAVYRTLLKGFEKAMTFACEICGERSSSEMCPSGLFLSPRIRRVAYEAWVAATKSVEWGPMKALTWAFRPKRAARKAEYLMSLHWLVLAQATNDYASAVRMMKRLSQLAGQILPNTEPKEQWTLLDFKTLYYRYLVQAYPWYARRYNQTSVEVR